MTSVPFFVYLFKVTISSAALLGYYWLFLRNRVFHQYNRFYLLTAVFVSLILPFFQIEILLREAPSSTVTQLYQVVYQDGMLHDEIYSASVGLPDAARVALFVYAFVSILILLMFIRSVITVLQLKNSGYCNKLNTAVLVTTSAKGTPFSFMHYIFWNKAADIQTAEGKRMLQHELTHVNQRHSWDILFLNCVLTLCWINPLFWLIKKELCMVHEYLADKGAIPENDPSILAGLILNAAYPQKNFLISNFFHSPIKKRLNMFTKTNKNPGYANKLLVLPLLIAIFSILAFKPIHRTVSMLKSDKKYTVIIDAGHGAHDFGAKAPDGTLEKDITLQIAQKIKELNRNSQYEIIMSRSGDEYMSPPQRVDFAASKKADMVISIHADMALEPAEKSKSGIHIYLPPDNSLVRKQSEFLGSALIQEFKKNPGIEVFDKIIQHKKSAWILKQAPCPTVLIETGYFSNKKDLDYLKSGDGQTALAHDVLSALEKYFAASK